MEPVTAIVTALALGAAAGLKDTATQAVKDGYASLKTRIQQKYARVNLELLEAAPDSKSQQAVVEEDLAKVGADYDEEILRIAKDLMDTIQGQAPGAASVIGIDLEDIKGASLSIIDVIASGTGVKTKHADISGDIEIRKVRAGQQGSDIEKKN